MKDKEGGNPLFRSFSAGFGASAREQLLGGAGDSVGFDIGEGPDQLVGFIELPRTVGRGRIGDRDPLDQSGASAKASFFIILPPNAPRARKDAGGRLRRNTERANQANHGTGGGGRIGLESAFENKVFARKRPKNRIWAAQ